MHKRFHVVSDPYELSDSISGHACDLVDLFLLCALVAEIEGPTLTAIHAAGVALFSGPSS
ncbi:hypothetical protein [Mycobacterium leprae]|uniref:hypothetical protein n=1 Tax=Mycobacterium leprae TaxID=1769 RepID=UPI000AA24410|nr:hypothetical protein [Mycobacterium leprae]